MPDIATIWLRDADMTHSAGKSLASSIYPSTKTIGLHGDLGAGKTTFMQGFLEGMGVKEAVTSPTYALEQRYNGKFGEILHIDLYRLKESQAHDLLEQSEETNGIRCIEWLDRAGNVPCDIRIHLEDAENGGRNLRIEFHDIDLPSLDQISTWRNDVCLPEHIAKHCDAVAAFAEHFCQQLLTKGIVCRPQALSIAGKLHDLLRFVDFKDTEESPIWNEWSSRYVDQSHEEACASFLTEEGYPELAEIIRTHGLASPMYPLQSIEQKVLFYADKRVAEDTIVSLKERFDDFVERYGNGEQSDLSKQWYEAAVCLEKELLSL